MQFLLNSPNSNKRDNNNPFKINNQKDYRQFNTSANEPSKLSSPFHTKESNYNDYENQRSTKENYITIIRNSPTPNKEYSVFDQSFNKKSSVNYNDFKKKRGYLENLDISNIRSTNNNEYREIKSPIPKKSEIKKKGVDLLTKKHNEIFDKVYTFNSEFVNNLKNEQSKKSNNLKDYQSNIMRLVTQKGTKDNIRGLSQQFKDIRDVSESSPRIKKTNWKLYGKIINDCKNTIKAVKNKVFVENDIPEKIMKFQTDLEINSKKKKGTCNKRFCKYESGFKRVSPFIPEYLVEKFKNTLKIIN